MKGQTGFSMTELMVVMAIVAILLGIGVPSYRYITNSYRMSAEVNGLLGDLQYARAEAITVDAGETVLRVQGAFTGGGRFPDTFNADNNIAAITYNREGFATTAVGFPNTTITLHETSANAAWTRCLWITPVGLLTTETPANNPSGTCL